jgi:hypothetical protein
MVVETKKKMTQKLHVFFFLVFKKTHSSKPKISQIKIYLQETPRIKIFFICKASGRTLGFLNKDLRQTLNFFVVIFLVLFFIILY